MLIKCSRFYKANLDNLGQGQKLHSKAALVDHFLRPDVLLHSHIVFHVQKQRSSCEFSLCRRDHLAWEMDAPPA